MHTTSRTRPTYGINLGLLTLHNHEAGDFVELLLQYCDSIHILRNQAEYQVIWPRFEICTFLIQILVITDSGS